MIFYIKVKIVFVFFMSILCSLLIYTPRKIWLSSPSTRSIGQYWTKSRTYTQKNQTILDYGINVINETIYTRTDLLLLVSHGRSSCNDYDIYINRHHCTCHRCSSATPKGQVFCLLDRLLLFQDSPISITHSETCYKL
jgi:hypothetical protein